MSKMTPQQKPRKRKPSIKQKAGIENIMSGKYKTEKEALMAAGYSEESAKRGKTTVLQTKAAQEYLQNFEEKARARFGMTIESKLQDVYLEGLEADRPWGKKGLIPDFKMRKEYADKVAEMIGFIEAKTKQTGQQVNFFMFDESQRSEFNKMFNQYVRSKSVEAVEG